MLSNFFATLLFGRLCNVCTIYNYVAIIVWQNEGSTALYIAAEQGHCKAVEKLLGLKADVKQVDGIVRLVYELLY